MLTFAQEWRNKGIEQGRSEGLERGLERGRSEGLERGRVEEKHAIARNLLQVGTSVPVIVEATGLSREAVMGLAKESETVSVKPVTV